MNINRFIEAQESPYPVFNVALEEIRSGRKQSHWIWFIFPQLRGLGRSYNANFYGLADKAEAEEFYAHPVLCSRLREITQALLLHRGKNPKDVLGGIDAMKVRSCMTLFDIISPNDIFAEILESFYDGKPCRRTLALL